MTTSQDRKSTRLNSRHLGISYAVFCLKKKKKQNSNPRTTHITASCSLTPAMVLVMTHDERSRGASSSFPSRSPAFVLCFFFFNDTATTEIYTLSLHDALPISVSKQHFPDGQRLSVQLQRPAS